MLEKALRDVIASSQLPDRDRAATRMLGEGEEHPQSIIGFLRKLHIRLEWSLYNTGERGSTTIFRRDDTRL